LETAGSRAREDVDGKRRSGKRIIARALWEIASTGRTSLPREDGGVEIKVEGAAWFDVVKWLYQHIDGPPNLRVEGAGEDGAFIVRVVGGINPGDV